jgi:hypothetical protein
MKTTFCRLLVFFSVVFSSAIGQPQMQDIHPVLRPYVTFLQDQKTNAADYILGLFEKHDIVILCERDHRDTTQYNLFLHIMQDARFVNTVGRVFTEIGASNLYPQVNEFLHTPGLPTDSVEKAIRYFHRNCSFYPLWEKENFSYFLRGLYTINERLSTAKKIDFYPSDVPLDWPSTDSLSYRKFFATLGTRDSVMAFQIIRKLDEIRQQRPGHAKALVIMNYRHAFGHRFEYPVGKKPNNVGRFLFERYGDRVANVYINGYAFTRVRSDNDVETACIRDGAWDAAFKTVQKEDVGFDFAGSPFGADHFDIWPFQNHPFTFSDVFTGFVYYLPFQKHCCVVGVPGIVDSAFAPELARRQVILDRVQGRDASYVNMRNLNNMYGARREFPPEGLDSLTAQINKWLR